METPLDAQCKWIMAILSPRINPRIGLWEQLEKVFGPIEYKGPFIEFDGTEYYRQEHGNQLFRGFIAFKGLGNPEKLSRQKHLAAQVESHFSALGAREFNLDMGYLDADKLVLASFKRGPSKLYIGNAVYADLLLKYCHGHFDPLPWAFPDFQDGRYLKSLNVIRQKFKAEMRRIRSQAKEIAK